MFRSVISLILTLFALSLPAMAEPQYSTAPGYHRVDWDDDDRVCCARDGRAWWSNERECRRYGGYATANRVCRNQGDDRSFGFGYNFQGHDPNERVCCQRDSYNGSQVWWSTFGQCARARGQFTANKVCRKYAQKYGNYDYNYDNGYGYGYGQGLDPNERVCCQQYDGQVWWTSRGECYRARGQQTMNKVCRKAY